MGSIYAPEDCPVLCTNIVRGILNMMQITIKKSQNVYELQEVGFFSILTLLLFSFYCSIEACLNIMLSRQFSLTNLLL